MTDISHFLVKLWISSDSGIVLDFAGSSLSFDIEPPVRNYELNDNGDTYSLWFAGGEPPGGVDNLTLVELAEYQLESHLSRWDDTVRLTAAKDSVHAGRGDDKVYGRAGNDAIAGDKGDDKLFGGPGNDRLYGDYDRFNPVRGNDTIKGGAGKDDLYGGKGNDKLYGGRGKDLLSGGTGNDTLKGGKGPDSFLFNDTGAPPGSPVAQINREIGKKNADRIVDFDVKHDKIVLSGFSALSKYDSPNDYFVVGKEASSKHDHVIYNSKNGHLIYDLNGSGPGGSQLIAYLSKHIQLTADNLDYSSLFLH